MHKLLNLALCCTFHISIKETHHQLGLRKIASFYNLQKVGHAVEKGKMRLQCSTCLERMSPEEDLGSTPCGHVFHMVCVLQWFENKKNCPQVIWYIAKG